MAKVITRVVIALPVKLRSDCRPWKNRHGPLGRGRALDSSGGVDLTFIEGFVNEQLFDDPVEPASIISQNPPRFGVTLVGDAPHFFVDGVRACRPIHPPCADRRPAAVRTACRRGTTCPNGRPWSARCA